MPQSDEPADDVGEEKCSIKIEDLDETEGKFLRGNLSEDEQEKDNDEEDFVKSKTENFYQDNEEAKTRWAQDVVSNDQKDKVEDRVIDFKENLNDTKREHHDIYEEVDVKKEEIFSEDECLTCFCILCTSHVDPLAEDKASKQAQMFNSNFLLESINHSRYGTNLEAGYENNSLSLENVNVEVTEVTSCPNTGRSAEGGGVRKQGLMTYSVNKKEKGKDMCFYRNPYLPPQVLFRPYATVA